MIEDLEVCFLVDNNCTMGDLKSEHGLSLWIKADEQSILFDTGQSDIILENAQHLRIDLSTANALVLSHGHYDHTGGVAKVLAANQSIKAFCHPGVFMPRYSRQPDGTMKPIGISASASSALSRIIDRIQWVNEPALISDDIGITGPIPRVMAFEDTGGAFFLDPEAKNSDPISDDLALWFRTKNGIVLVTGCCHSGIVNTLEHVRKITKQVQIHAVIGGFHLLHASPERLTKTCEYLKTAVSGGIYPCHCTGDDAIEYMQSQFGGKIIVGSVGACFQF